MDDKIPIIFEHDGKQYIGEFSKVSGSGSTTNLHLMINQFYQGQISYSENYGWRYTSNSGKFDDLSDFFGNYLIAVVG